MNRYRRAFTLIELPVVTPYWGTSATVLGCSHTSTSRASSRHNAGADINFSDGHASYYKYSCICASTAGDPKRPDINWTRNGQ